MFTFENAIEKSASDRIAGLDVSAFSERDVLNLVLQRSEILRDRPDRNRYIKDWMRGDEGPLLGLIDEIGTHTLIRRAASFILLEYEELKEELVKMRPGSATDIGCGYAIFDLFLAQDFGCDLVLVDLESTEERHFGFEEKGSAYSNLEVAARFLADNGVAKERMKTLNPASEPLENVRGQDLAFSFISCGFHYPWKTYETFFENSVVPGGNIMLDVRNAALTQVLGELSALGHTRTLDAGFSRKATRVVVSKPAQA